MIDSIILAPIELVPSAAQAVAEFAADHPYAAVAVGTVVVGMAAWKGYELAHPYVAPAAVQLNEWRRDAQTAIADAIRPTPIAMAPIALSAP